MNNFLTGQAAAVPATLILGVIYIALYVILSLLVHAADLRNITKVPFGSYEGSFWKADLSCGESDAADRGIGCKT